MPVYFIIVGDLVLDYASEKEVYYRVSVVQARWLVPGEFCRVGWSLFKVQAIEGTNVVLMRSKRSKGRWANATRLDR
jgi:hypothetical protein